MNRKSYASRPRRLLAGKAGRNITTALVVFVASTVAGGCMSGKITKGRDQFYRGEYSEAAATLSSYMEDGGKDRVLGLLEYGMALHAAGNYEESNKALLEADKIIEQNDVISVSETSGSMVSNDMIKTFKPEIFEWILVHTYLAMNFMILDDWSAARVEAKKCLALFDRVGDEERLDQYAFTRYVCALAFEVMGDYDDAYIEYKAALKSGKESVPLYYDLYRISVLRRNRGEANKWKKKLAKRGVDAPNEPKTPNVIVFVNAGRGPHKVEENIVVPPHANRFVVPKYVSSESRAYGATLRIEGVPPADSDMLMDLDPLAEATLQARMAKIIAKETARVVAKEAITQSVEKQNAVLGLATRAAFFASEAADTRAWETLPRYLGVISDYVPPGEYEMKVHFHSREGAPMETVNLGQVTVEEGRRRVFSVRSVE